MGVVGPLIAVGIILLIIFIVIYLLIISNPVKCVSNSDCKSDQICTTGVCIAKSTTPTTVACVATSQCPTGQLCQSGICTTVNCTTNAQCPAGGACESGHCVIGTHNCNGYDPTQPSSGSFVGCRVGDVCASTADCRAGTHCVNSQCVVVGGQGELCGASTLSQCQAGYSCDTASGRCLVNTPSVTLCGIPITGAPDDYNGNPLTYACPGTFCGVNGTCSNQFVDGHVCSFNGQCYSGLCYNAVCTDPNSLAQIGQPCNVSPCIDGAYCGGVPFNSAQTPVCLSGSGGLDGSLCYTDNNCTYPQYCRRNAPSDYAGTCVTSVPATPCTTTVNVRRHTTNIPNATNPGQYMSFTYVDPSEANWYISNKTQPVTNPPAPLDPIVPVAFTYVPPSGPSVTYPQDPIVFKICANDYTNQSNINLVSHTKHSGFYTGDPTLLYDRFDDTTNLNPATSEPWLVYTPGYAVSGGLNAYLCTRKLYNYTANSSTQSYYPGNFQTIDILNDPSECSPIGVVLAP